MKTRTKVVIWLAVLSTIIALLCWQSMAFALDVNLITVTEGTIDSKSSYYVFGGSATPKDPAFENRYKSDYYAKGAAGLLMQNSFAGAVTVKEQFEVQSGYGRFETKVGTGSLINIPREADPAIIDGVLIQNAAGFGGELRPGIVTSEFSTATGFVAKSNSEGIGEFRAGAIKRVETGSNEQGTGPTIVESQEAHINIDGKFKVQVEFVFPK
jgi:hypothetical protein